MNQDCNLSLAYYLSTSCSSLDDTAWQTVICIAQNRFDVTAFSHLDSQEFSSFFFLFFFRRELGSWLPSMKYPKELLKMKYLHYSVSEKWKYKNNQVAVINITCYLMSLPLEFVLWKAFFFFCFLDVVFEADKCFCVVPSPHRAYFLPSWKGINVYNTSLTYRFIQHWQRTKCFLLDGTQRADWWVSLYQGCSLSGVPVLCVHRQHFA